MELMMNRAGWYFSCVRGGRLVFRSRAGEERSFKDWMSVGEFLRAIARGDEM